MTKIEAAREVQKLLPDVSGIDRISSVDDDSYYRFLCVMDSWYTAGVNSVIRTDSVLSEHYQAILNRFSEIFDDASVVEYRVIALHHR